MCGTIDKGVAFTTKSTGLLQVEFTSNGDEVFGDGARCFVSCSSFAKSDKCGTYGFYTSYFTQNILWRKKKYTKKSYLVCGQLNKNAKASNGQKIVGGEESKVNEIPWVAAVSSENSFDGQSCGGRPIYVEKYSIAGYLNKKTTTYFLGTVLSDTWVLSAAHCINP